MAVASKKRPMPSTANTDPYYFLSYAHTPPVQGGRNQNAWMARFHQDLSELIMELTTLPAGAAPGFFDEEIDPGTRWNDELLYQLNHCRVFLPMFSPRYFTSDWTLKEWYAFSRRHATAPDGGETRNTGALGVSWAEFDRRQVPDAIRESQAFRPRVFGGHPELFRLLARPRLEDEYRDAIYEIAKSVIETADSIALSPTPFKNVEELDEAYKNSALYEAFKGIRR
jgi:hypothetical protein